MLAAGADILETYSFGADEFTAAEYGADASQRREWTRKAVTIAREATAGQGFIVSAVGPSTDSLSVIRGHSFDAHVAAFEEQIRDLWTTGVDAIPSCLLP